MTGQRQVQQPQQHHTRRLLHRLLTAAGSPWVRIGFLVAAVALAVYAVGSRWDDVSADLQRIGWGSALLSLVPMVAGLGTGMLSWRSVLAGLGSPLPLRVSAQIYFLGQLGKYLPGAVWPVVSQMELGSDHDVPRRRSVAALLIAVLVSLATGLVVGGLIAAIRLGGRHGWLWLLPAAGLAIGVLILPPVLLALLRRLPKVRFEGNFGWEPLLRALAWSTLGWGLYGLHAAVLGAAADDSSLGRTLLLSIGAYAVAWCAGMVAFLLPAGAGARDGVLVLILSSATTSSAAIAVAVVSRVVTTVADLGLAGWAAAYTASHRPNRQPSPPAAD